MTAKSPAKKKPTAVPYGAWGYVAVTTGRFAGRIGYYDDDDTARTAIVYLDGGLAGLPPVFGDYELISRSSLRPATAAEVREYQARNENDLSLARAARKLAGAGPKRK